MDNMLKEEELCDSPSMNQDNKEELNFSFI